MATNLRKKSKLVLASLGLAVLGLALGLIGLIVNPSVISFMVLTVNMVVSSATAAILSLRERG